MVDNGAGSEQSVRVSAPNWQGLGEKATEYAAGALEEARSALPHPDEGGLGWFGDFLAAGELGLAFEALVAAAEAQRASHEVWESLCGAAMIMEIENGSDPHFGAMQSARRHFSG